MVDKLQLGRKQRRRFNRLRDTIRSGGELNDKQQRRFDRLKDKKQLYNVANKTSNPGAFAAEAAAAGYQAEQGINYANADQYNPFGSQTTTIDPVTGRPTTTQNLSDPQQGILDRGQQLTQMGQDLAKQNLGGYSQFRFDDKGERSRIEDEVFNRLNRDTEMNREREMKAKEQELFNKGIPYSNDPNSRFQQEIGDLNRRYDDITASNRSRAVEQGGDELQRNYGFQLGQHQQGLSDTGYLQGMGTGLMLPQFQGFQGVGYNLNNPTDVQMGFDQLQLQRDQLAQQGHIAQQQIGLQQQALNPPPPPPPPPSAFEE